MSKVNFKTKLGTLMWVNIGPGGVDTSMPKSGSVRMQKTATLIVKHDSAEAKAMLKELSEIWEKFRVEKDLRKRQPKSNGSKVMMDKKTDLPTGDIAFIFKTNAVLPSGKEVEVPVYDAKGQKIDLVDIGNGSKGVIHGEAALYEFGGQFGITLYLKAVQVGELVSPMQVEADDLTVLYPDAFGQPVEREGIAPLTEIEE